MGVLDGIVRHKLLTQVPGIGLETAETVLEKSDFGDLRGLFITNSLLGCVPIRRLDGHEIPFDADLAAQLARLLD